MAIRIEHVGDVAVLIPEGLLTGGQETDDLSRTLEALLNDPDHPKILWDMSETKLMTSIPLGVMVDSVTRATEHGIPIHFCGATPEFAQFLERGRVRWPTPVAYFDTREEALKALQEA